MKTHIIAALGLAMSLSISSCSDFMNLTPEDQYDEETVWSDAIYRSKFADRNGSGY